MMVATGKMTHFNINFKSRFKMTQETIPFERYAFKKVSNGRYTITIPYLGSQLVLKIMGKVLKKFRDRNDLSKEGDQDYSDKAGGILRERDF